LVGGVSSRLLYCTFARLPSLRSLVWAEVGTLVVVVESAAVAVVVLAVFVLQGVERV